MRRTTSNLRKFLIALNVLVIVGLGGASAYLYIENRDLKADAALTEEERKTKKNNEIVAEVGELLELPDEEPIIVVVNDPNSLGEEGLDSIISSLFDDLQKNDYILIFRSNRLGVQYRQSDNKVVKSTDVPIAVSVEVIGTEAGLARAETQLSQFGDQLVLTKRVDANVTQSYVVDVNGKLGDEANSIAQQLGIQVGTTLPAKVQPAELTEIVVFVADEDEASDSSE